MCVLLFYYWRPQLLNVYLQFINLSISIYLTFAGFVLTSFFNRSFMVTKFPYHRRCRIYEFFPLFFASDYTKKMKKMDLNSLGKVIFRYNKMKTQVQVQKQVYHSYIAQIA